MDLIPNHPTAIAVIIAILTMFFSSLIQWTFLIRLRSKHNSQWIHAGSPTIWSDQSFISAWPTIQYLKNKQYVLSGNAEGINFCGKFRYPMIIGYWTTIIVFVAVIIVGIINGWPPSWKQTE